jgi:DNA-binding transcriptional regulator YbjK
VPPSNERRRNELTDAAIEVVAQSGLHGLSHRAVDVKAEVPRGTTSNYFRSREPLVAAMVQRIVHLHFALIAELRAQHEEQADGLDVVDFLGEVVDYALTKFPGRYLALFELAVESTRTPELRQELNRIADEAMKLTHEAHRGRTGEPSRQDIELLNAFYNGVLFTYLVMPQTLGGQSPGEITRTMLRRVLKPGQASGATTTRGPRK